MRPRFLGTRQYPRVVGGAGSTQRFRAAKSRARVRGQDMLRIDLAGVISKYIGETERNLSRLLDAAERSNAALYFDEADNLFGDADGDARARAGKAKRSLLRGARRRRIKVVIGKGI